MQTDAIGLLIIKTDGAVEFLSVDNERSAPEEGIASSPWLRRRFSAAIRWMNRRRRTPDEPGRKPPAS
ncbi:hypothetical protein ACFQFG_07430 [Methylobacterium persicinum]